MYVTVLELVGRDLIALDPRLVQRVFSSLNAKSWILEFCAKLSYVLCLGFRGAKVAS